MLKLVTEDAIVPRFTLYESSLTFSQSRTAESVLGELSSWKGSGVDSGGLGVGGSGSGFAGLFCCSRISGDGSIARTDGLRWTSVMTCSGSGGRRRRLYARKQRRNPIKTEKLAKTDRTDMTTTIELEMAREESASEGCEAEGVGLELEDGDVVITTMPFDGMVIAEGVLGAAKELLVRGR